MLNNSMNAVFEQIFFSLFDLKSSLLLKMNSYSAEKMTLGHLNFVSDCVLSTSKTCIDQLKSSVQKRPTVSDDFGPPFTKPQKYLLSCNVAVAK